MFSIVRKRLTYTNVLLTFILVFAMSGGAYAASKYLITSTKQISPKVLKALQGRAGAKGVKGATGAIGPAGAAGPAGPAGERGASGANGTNGESVTSTTIGKGSHCSEGGSEFKVGGKATYACDGTPGTQGAKGAAGSPWTAGGTLPAKATETGTFAAGAFEEDTPIAISFPIPLAAVLTGANVHVIEIGEGEGEASENPAIVSGECKGTHDSPGASPGNLCVFNDSLGAAKLSALVDFNHNPPELGAGTTGTVLETETAQANPGESNYGALVQGTWAVTG